MKIIGIFEDPVFVVFAHEQITTGKFSKLWFSTQSSEILSETNAIYGRQEYRMQGAKYWGKRKVKQSKPQFLGFFVTIKTIQWNQSVEFAGETEYWCRHLQTTENPSGTTEIIRDSITAAVSKLDCANLGS